MTHHPSTAIIGFFKPQTDASASRILSPVPGFVRILRLYRFTIACLVQVDPPRLNTFMDGARQLDEVEYAEQNHLVQLSSYNEHVHPSHSASQWSSERARVLHNIRGNSLLAGLGVKIAIIDSGLAPHPYLPALSSTEMISSTTYWKLKGIQNNTRVQREIDRLKTLENPSLGKSSPLAHSADPKLQDQYRTDSKLSLEKIEEALWLGWVYDAEGWRLSIHSQQSSGYRLGSSQNVPLPPPIPVQKHLPGLLRRVSFDSYNFVNDDLNVEDSDGHGTCMVGILAGIPEELGGLSFSPQGVQKTPSNSDILGIVPYAELIICKVYETRNRDDSNLDAVIRALEHAVISNADIIYIGLGFDPGRAAAKPILSLDRTISAIVNKHEILIVCPAGNRRRSSLDFPAATREAIAVSAVTFDPSDPQKVELTDYSNTADQNEELAFCAFGGDEKGGVLTTSPFFGFMMVSGTSVAAAIATGILAENLSRRCVQESDREYEKQMQEAILQGNRFSSLVPLNIFASQKRLPEVLREAKRASEKNYFPGESFPSKRFGSGVIKSF